tara:strand:+ start:145 stop:537 length:393 start_codon:yes stop_codon:yes gene_type:complete
MFLSLTILICYFPIIIGIHMNNSIILIIVGLLLISCGDRFYRVVVPQGNLVTDEMIQQLEVGMTEAQVNFIMGTPLIRDPLERDRWEYYRQIIHGEKLLGKTSFTLNFESGRLISWTNNLEESKNKDQPN